MHYVSVGVNKVCLNGSPDTAVVRGRESADAEEERHIQAKLD